MRRLLTAATLGLGLIAAAATGTAAFAMPPAAGHQAHAPSAPVTQVRFGGDDHSHMRQAPRHWQWHSRHHYVAPRHTHAWPQHHQYGWR